MSRKRNNSRFGRVDKRPNGLWRARYTHPEKPRKDSGALNLITLGLYDTPTEAKNRLEKVRVEIQEGTWKSPEQKAAERDEAERQARLDAYTFGEWAEKHAARRINTGKWSPSYARTETDRLRKHIIPKWGDVPLKEITRRAVKEWVADLCPDTPSQRAHVWGLFNSILEAALDAEYIDVNPAKRAYEASRRGRTETRQHPHRVLTIDEVRTIADALPSRLRIAVYLQAFAGLRPSEAREVRGKDIETRPNGITYVSVSRAVTGKTRSALAIGPTKTAASERPIPLPDSIGALIAERAREVGDEGLLVHEGADTSMHVLQNTYQKAMMRALRESGLDAACTYCLRHTFISHVAAETRDIVATREMARHTSITTTNRYLHATDGKAEATAKALDAAITDHAPDVADLDEKRRERA